MVENYPSKEPSRNILKLRTNWVKFPSTGQQAHVCAPKPVGMSLANEARNIFFILRDEIKKINALIENSPLCIHCYSIETLSHMPVNCIIIQKFWFEVPSWWKNNSGESLLFDDLSVMYGYNPEDPKMHILTYFILLEKKHINLNPQALITFLNLLKTR